MRKTLKKYFIPHEHNNYTPHILKERSVLVLALISVLLFGIFAFEGLFIASIRNIAAILPAVLTDYANDTRGNMSLAPLSIDPLLVEAAQMKANDMAAKSYFAHTSPEGVSPWFWISRAGYNFTYAGENLAVHFADSYDVHKAWLNSPGHRANIVNTNFTEIGIATAEGSYEGRPTIFVVQMFGRPAPTFDITPPVVAANQPEVPTTEPTPVAGAETVDESRFDLEPIEIIIENDLFVVARNPTTPVANAEEGEGSASVAGQESYASWFEELLSTPKRTLTFAYSILAAIIIIALILAALIEVRRQHPKHIFYAIGLLILIGILLYVARAVILPQALIT